MVLLVGSSSLATAATDRSLKLFFTHTGERATITFKRGGKFDGRGLGQINRFLRDWRKNEPANIDPRLLDLVWEVYQRSGSNDYIHIVSAYRSPGTNKMLRGRSRDSGVAKNSQHTLGKAMDFYIPGVKLAKLRSLAMQMQVGGVGYYPASGSPFVHLDVGNVRAWPRMTRKELARIFPNGKTMHLPSDGRPLPGYDLAVADYRRRVGAKSIEIASSAGDDDSNFASASSNRSSLVTAMLPTGRSRAEDALELQTSRPAMVGEQRSEFTDLSFLAIPVPAARPTSEMETPEVEVASLGPITDRTQTDSFRPSAILDLPAPAALIARFPITAADRDADEEADGHETLMTWALSAPEASTGLTAPLISARLFAIRTTQISP
ncbi:uncharacterized protein YcbK (DUF882 family) [Rhizobium rosettiformans]|uniref:Murein endopeptidase K n=1 Tax=Rhizobium rosettiformans TaxID=1368430 RepID=A0A7W8HTX0_9HYPH|nr:uncharacterized protein YcbK (DUF882 family) [Rhizobium rosettiformans]